MSADLHNPSQLAALSPLAPEVAATIARVASDIALVIDREGVICSVSEGNSALPGRAGDWVGRRWVDTVTADTRAKIETLLNELRSGGVTQRREVNHPGADGETIPIAWAAIQLGDDGPVVAVGRDLRAVAAIQRRFLDAQQDMERDYWQRRQAENRFRLLFQVASDGVLVLDADSLLVLEANDAAAALLMSDGASLAGRSLAGLLPGLAHAAVLELLATARSNGRAGEIRVRIGGALVDLSATPFTVGDRLQLLVRARCEEGGHSTLPVTVAGFVDSTPDGVVITDSSGRVQLANPAFVALVQQGNEAQLRGRALDEVVGDASGEWRALVLRTRLKGLAPRSVLQVRRGLLGIAVEASAALLTEGDQERLGFIVRASEPQGMPVATVLHEAAQAFADLDAQVGRVGLAELLRETADLAEHHFVETALIRSGGLVGAAAELLSVTPDALLLRMKRLGLALPLGALELPPKTLN